MTTEEDVPLPGSLPATAVLEGCAHKLTPSILAQPVLTASDRRVAACRAELGKARVAYRDEHDEDATEAAHRLVARLRRLRAPADDDTEILGSALTLLGLIKSRAGQAGARAPFASAVQAFSRLPADRLTGMRGAVAADYGIALQRAGDHRGAEAALRRALDLGSDTPDVRRHLGAALRDLGEPGSAEQVLTDALERAPLDWQAAEWLTALHEALGTEPGDVGREWAAAGQLLLDQGIAAQEAGASLRGAGLARRAVAAYRKAARAYRQAVRLRPDDVPLRLAAAKAMAQSGAQAAAARALRAGSAIPMTVSTRLDFADLLLDLGEGKAAAAAFRAVLDAEPDNERAVVGLGWALIAGQDPGLGEAERVLSRARHAHPGSVDILALLGETARLQGHYLKAIELFDQALARGGEACPAGGFLHGSKGQALRAHGDRDGALRELLRAVKLDPGRGWIHRELAGLYAESGDLDGQVRELRAAAVQDGACEDLVDLGVALARQAREAGQGSRDIAIEAVRVLEQAHRALPDDRDVRGCLARVLYDVDRDDEAASLLTANLAEDPGRLDDLEQLAEIERARGDLATAVQRLDQVIAARPDDAYALSVRAAARLRLGDDKEAEQDARRSLGAEPGDLFTLKVLRDSLIRQGRPADAVAVLGRETEKGEASPDLQYLYGETLHEAGRLTEARSVLDKALWEKPLDVAIQRELGWVLLDLYEAAEAVAHFAAAAQAAPDDPEIVHEEATARVLSGQFKEALDRLTAWLGTHPGDAKAHYLVGWLFYRAGAWQQAEAAMRQAVRLDPGDPLSHRQLAAAILRAGDPQLALPEFEEAIRLDPESPWTRRGYGKALWMAGRDDEARASWEETLRLLGNEPADNQEVAALKGWCLGRLGRSEDALAEYRKALASPQWEASVTWFDYAITELADGSAEDARRSLERAWRSVEGEPPLRRRGIVAEALEDLRIAQRLVPRVRESRTADDIAAAMTAYVRRIPEPCR
jgi:tetratricopeptide (TPR) repeat protein